MPQNKHGWYSELYKLNSSAVKLKKKYHLDN